jgi:tyrosine-protein kinase Etk/Wzc
VGFLDDQIRALSMQLAAAEDALQAFREANLVIAPEAEASAQMERLAEMQAERDAIAAEGAALAELLREIEAEGPTAAGDSSAYRRLIAFPTLFRNPAASELLGQLAEVENERAELLGRRTMDDVDVRVLTNRIREIERELLRLATTYLQGLREQVRSLDATLAGYRDELERVPERDLQYTRLLREATVLNEIFLTLQNRLKEAELRVAVQDVSARVVDPAILPDDPVKPNIPVSLVFALILGGVLGLGGALARDAMDTTVRTRNDLQDALGLTVLGSIPRVPGRANGRRLGRDRQPQAPRLVTGQDPRSPYVEAYRSLRTNITFAGDTRPRTLVFTSALPGDGKSTTAVNLALTLAQQEAAVLLVDADLRRGALHDLFDGDREPGLSDVIRGGASLDEAIQSVRPGETSRLHFLATGPLPSNPAELLGSDAMHRLLDEWRTRYEMVILDAPPLNVVSDAAILGTRADGVLLVARSGVTDRGAARLAMEQLEKVRASVLGTVLHDLDLRQEPRAAAAHAYLHGGSP